MQTFWNWLVVQDQNIFLAINHFLNQIPGLEYIFGWPTHLGQIQYLLPVTALFLFFWDRPRWFQIFLAALTAVVLSFIASELLKDFFDRPRPFTDFSSVITHFELPSSRAFPSGHVVAITSVTVLLNQIYNNKLVWSYLLILWMGLTRIYVGVHYPFDVIGGILLGTAGALVTLRLFRNWFMPVQQ